MLSAGQNLIGYERLGREGDALSKCCANHQGLGAVSKFFLGSIAEDAEKGAHSLLLFLVVITVPIIVVIIVILIVVIMY